ncbi:MAG: hypothetical protein KC615_12890, partial [Anaerolineae bacterium]|nr:hypothetical protein [Anaerolineae bacterium]
LPDLATGVTYTTVFSVTAPSDAVEGAQSIPFVLSSRDFSGQTYSDDATVSVMVLAESEGTAQVVLDSYLIDPSTAYPGETVTVHALFKNTGTESAEQVLVQLDGTNSILIAGAYGNSYAIGNMAAGAVEPVTMSFVVAGSAEAGAQSQSLAISYLQDNESRQGTASISLVIEELQASSPLLLLQSYSTGEDILEPGQHFTFDMTLQNAGSVDVSNLLVTFGSVSTSSSNSSNSSQSETSTTSTSSDDFAIYGSGDTVLLGDLVAGNTIHLTQDFIASSELSSGIHSLPITLQYVDAEGSEQQKSLSASVMVIVPPRLRLTAADELDETLTAEEEYTLTLSIENLGSSEVLLTDMSATGDNIEVTEGAEILLDPLQSDDDTSESVSFTPVDEGDYTLTISVNYINDLNQVETITQTYSGAVEAAAEVVRTPPQMLTQEETTEDSGDLIGRLLLGFLGFGG